VQTEKFMNDPKYRLFFDDGLLFLRELINFTPDLNRLLFKLCVKFEIPYDFAECTLNFPLIDKIMFNTGLRFSEKIIHVQLMFILTISTTLKNQLMQNWKN
jgi:hypothetical protein